MFIPGPGSKRQRIPDPQHRAGVNIMKCCWNRNYVFRFLFRKSSSSRSRLNKHSFSTSIFFLYKILHFNARSSIVFHKVGIYLMLVLHFMLDPGQNPVPEPECVPVPLRQKLLFLWFWLRVHNTDVMLRIFYSHVNLSIFTILDHQITGFGSAMTWNAWFGLKPMRIYNTMEFGSRRCHSVIGSYLLKYSVTILGRYERSSFLTRRVSINRSVIWHKKLYTH